MQLNNREFWQFTNQASDRRGGLVLLRPVAWIWTALYITGLRTLRNLVGLIVTIPHKLAAVSQVDFLTERSRLIQPVNFIAMAPDGKLTGDITDGLGMVSNLRGNGADPTGRRLLLVGAGGVGTAIAFAGGSRRRPEATASSTALA